MTTALILAGHGSHISPLTAGLVWQQVDKLRALGVADEVTATFWKETPSFATVINTLTADDLTIVPLFTAQGYFTRSVIPAEMRLDGAVTIRDGRTLRYAQTLGEHPFLREVVQRRVEDTLKLIDADSQKVGVALIGHGTKRNPQSRAATESQAQMLRDLQIVGEVTAVYLDDTPSIPEAYELLKTPIIIAVPNFLALGSHTTIDVPEALGLMAHQTRGEVQGRSVFYTDPIGTDDSLTNVIIELANRAGMRPSTRLNAAEYASYPVLGGDMLLDTVLRAGEIRFGQLILTPSEVRTEGYCPTLILSLPILREYLRTFPVFRPLATSTDMPCGWRFPLTQPQMLPAVVETVYPGALADWAAQRQNTLKIYSLNEVAARQKGMFRELANFDRTEEVVRQVCSGCVRHPTWHHGTSPENSIPCVEPCNLWMSKALETDE